MNLRSAANLIRNEYRERQTAADEAYRRAMEAHPELYAAEKAVRAAVLDGADNVAELERRRDKLAAGFGVKRAAPRCAQCGDTGVVGNEYCDCVRRCAARETVGFSAPPFAFGDGDTDVQTAKNAGMRSVSVLWGYRSRAELLAAGAERFAASFDELRGILLAME